MKISGVQKNKLLQSIKLGLIGIAVSIILILIFQQQKIFIEISLLGFTIGFMIGLFEYFISQPKLRKIIFPLAILLRSTVYAVIIILSVALLASIKLSFVNQCSLFEAFGDQNFFDFIVDANLHLVLAVLIVLSFLINFILQINQLLGPGVLINYLIGKYHKPKPEERIFLFLDLNSSTSIAEKLGTEKYSSYLKDFFSDITEPLLKTYGQVFQYVGDEVVVVWNVKDGLRNNNVLRFFFYVEECINRNKEKYLSKYGIIPEFKAGIHFGETLITEVGDIKREIVYHGDLVNTASRIRSACHTANRKVLISDTLLNKLDHEKEFQFEDMGEFKLKGKKDNIKLFSVELKNNNVSQLC
jgi:adenylate cyclase